MARTVNQAFEEFMRDSVNLDRDIVAAARASRDNLLKNIANFSGKDGFFTLHSEYNQHFGSFARKTKCRELDDIDLMIGISANGATYDGLAPWDNIRMWANPLDKAQEDCQNPDGTLNSRMVLNRFRKRISKQKEYACSEVERDKEVDRLNLKSKDWSFDIAPCFFTEKEANGRDYYLIPNGEGKWKKTDPRKDKEHVTRVNQNNNGCLLELIRLCKKWKNVKAKMLPSYLLETLVINFAEARPQFLTYHLDLRFKAALDFIADSIRSYVWDIKEIQGNINLLSLEDRYRIRDRAQNDSEKALQASISRKLGLEQAAINLWREIFGEEFPRYDG